MNQIHVKWKKVKNAKGYQLMVAKNKKFNKARKSYKVSGTSKTVTKLSAGTKYYVRVRAYEKAGKKTVYGKWSKARTVRTIKKHKHKWKTETSSKRVLVYNMVPFSQADGPNGVGSDNYLRKYRCMCNLSFTEKFDHLDTCSAGTYNDWVLINSIYHKSTSYYTTQNTTTNKCSICGAAKF